MKKLNTPIFIGVVLVLLYTRLNNLGAITSFLKTFFSVFSVFIYGGLIAFLLNPILRFMERKKFLNRKYNLFIIYFSLILLLTMFFYFIIPRLTRNIADLIDHYPKYIKVLEDFLNKYKHLVPGLKEVNIFNKLLLLQQKALIFVQKEFTFLISQFLGVTAKIFSLIFSIIFSVFFLSKKEYFKKLSLQILKLFLAKRTSTKAIVLSKRIERVFLGYLSGKTLDSIIIGIIAIIGLLLLQIPYVVLLGIFITIFNFIPYVGPLLGIILGVTITLFSIPSHAICVFIFLILLQQFDAWFLEPRILGNSLNLSMFWTIAAVTLGGSLFGAVGIIIAIPGFALIKELFLIQIKKDKIKRRKNLYKL